MTPLERAARAACVARGVDPDAYTIPVTAADVVMGGSWGGAQRTGTINWQLVGVPTARAVLEAVKEPDEETVKAAVPEVMGFDTDTPEPSAAIAKDAFTAMIDHILK